MVAVDDVARWTGSCWLLDEPKFGTRFQNRK